MPPLQFSPPDWIVKEYMDRKSPSEQANATVQQALETYIKMKAMDRQKDIGFARNICEGLRSRRSKVCR
jgi:hypothetical protein